MDAGDELARLRLDHSQDAPCPTVADVWSRWYLPDERERVGRGELAASTLAKYEYSWARDIEPAWGGRQVGGVRPLEVQQWVSDMGHSAATLAVRIMREMFDIAVRYELVDHNVMRERYRMPSKAARSERDKAVHSLDELGSDWAAVRGSWIEAAFLLAAFGSCRVGESLSPLAGEVERMDVDGVTVACVPIVRQIGALGEVKDTLKTSGSRRPVVVPGPMGERILELSASCRDTYLTDDGRGLPSTFARLNGEWRRLLGAAGIEPILFKNLRNSWQTNMRWSLRVPPWLIEPMMGHVEQNVTGRHYDRPRKEMFAEAVAAAYRENPFADGWT